MKEEREGFGKKLKKEKKESREEDMKKFLNKKVGIDKMRIS